MKLELELNGQQLLAVDASELEGALAGGCKCLVDLRKAMERSEDLAAVCKSKGVAYVAIPVTAATLSEQDLDFLRRETARNWGHLVVLSQGGQRAAALALMHAGRSGEWSDEQALERCPDLDPAWRERVTAYLARHRDRAAR